ncbi:F-box protein At2g27310-like [Tripterygium wilfordii]|nr:F-box protein At2g27310-like [Tripterygium wilfordii]
MSCTSTQFLALSADGKLWQEICSTLWSSTNDSRVRQVISTFPGGHRSFFSDSFPLLHHKNHNQDLSSEPSDLISAVDLCYKNKLLFSKVRETNTTTTKFLCSRFKIELLGQKETVSTPIQQFGEIDALLQDLKENLSLSWIVIDPAAKRAANLSSGRPVLVEWPCTGGEVQLYYSTVMKTGGRPGSVESEFAECRVVVTCSGIDGGEVHVDDITMEIKDIDGRSFDGRESLVILQDSLVNGKRERGKRGENEDKYKKLEKRKREGKVKKLSSNGVIYMICLPVVGLVTFWFTLFLFAMLLMRSKTRSKLRKH